MGNSHGKLVAYEDQGISLKQFKLQRVVGRGAFGKVRIVERKDNGLTFALKYIRKEDAVRAHSVRNIIRERRMLQRLAHPFLCNLRYSFQDIEYIYIAVDLMTGGDLRFHITRKAFTEEAVQFWIAQLACALRYIHSQGIVHRDVKPDNVLLDSDGHVHLTDFNVAAEFHGSKLLTGRSGTMAYIAPEAIDGTGYRSEVDWWSLGVTFYECIYNKRPFAGKTHSLIGEAIKNNQPRYYTTEPAVSPNCLSAISALLQHDTTIRVGACSWESFITHPFFKMLDFEALERKEIKPVFQPSTEKTNFDATYDLEELLLEDAPLEARARRQKPRGELKMDASEKEIQNDELHRLMETMFEPFDYTTVPGYDQRNLLPPSNNKGATPSALASTGSKSPRPMTSYPPGPMEHPDNISYPPSQSSVSQPSSSINHSLHSLENEEIPIPGHNFDSMTHAQRASTQTIRPRNSHPDLSGSDRGPPTPPPNGVFTRSSSYQTTQSNHSSSFGLSRLHLHLHRPKTSAASGAPTGPSFTSPRRSSHMRRGPSSFGEMHTKTGDVCSMSSGDAFSNQNSKKEGARYFNADGVGNTDHSPMSFNRVGSAGSSTSATSGIMSFFSRRNKGKDGTPKTKWPGVLGKEGARVIIS